MSCRSTTSYNNRASMLPQVQGSPLPKATARLIVKPTRNIFELREIYRLVHDQYVKRGYMAPHRSKMRFSILDLLPTCTAFIATHDSQLVGTVSGVITSSAGLPSSGTFGETLKEFATVNRIVAEGTKLACTEDTLDFGAQSAACELIRCWFYWGLAHGVDDLVLVVNPRHKFFWERGLGFQVIAESAACSHVKENPGILFHLDLARTRAKEIHFPRLAKKVFFRSSIDSATYLNLPQLKDDDVYDLLKEQPELMDSSPREHRQALLNVFPTAVRRLLIWLKSGSPFIFSHRELPIEDISQQISQEPILTWMPLRSELRGILEKLEGRLLLRKIGVKAAVRDDVPDNIILDRNAFSRLIDSIAGHLSNFANSGDTMGFTTDLQKRVGDEVELKMVFRLLKTVTDNVNNSTPAADRWSAACDRSIELSHYSELLQKIGGGNLTFEATSNNSQISFTLGCTVCETTIFHTYEKFNQEAETFSSQARRSFEKSSLQVLVVEDNFVNQVLVRKILQKYGHSPVVANNGLEALSILKVRTFDLVLMDCQMPVMDGFEATKKIRDLDAQKSGHTPIIALTAFNMKGDMERCLEAGMDAYIAKPIHVETLIHTMQKLVPAADHPLRGNYTELKTSTAK